MTSQSILIFWELNVCVYSARLKQRKPIWNSKELYCEVEQKGFHLWIGVAFNWCVYTHNLNFIIVILLSNSSAFPLFLKRFFKKPEEGRINSRFYSKSVIPTQQIYSDYIKLINMHLWLCLYFFFIILLHQFFAHNIDIFMRIVLGMGINIKYFSLI